MLPKWATPCDSVAKLCSLITGVWTCRSNTYDDALVIPLTTPRHALLEAEPHVNLL